MDPKEEQSHSADIPRVTERSSGRVITSLLGNPSNKLKPPRQCKLFRPQLRPRVSPKSGVILPLSQLTLTQTRIHTLQTLLSPLMVSVFNIVPRRRTEEQGETTQRTAHLASLSSLRVPFRVFVRLLSFPLFCVRVSEDSEDSEEAIHVPVPWLPRGRPQTFPKHIIKTKKKHEYNGVSIKKMLVEDARRPREAIACIGKETLQERETHIC